MYSLNPVALTISCLVISGAMALTRSLMSWAILMRGTAARRLSFLGASITGLGAGVGLRPYDTAAGFGFCTKPSRVDMVPPLARKLFMAADRTADFCVLC